MVDKIYKERPQSSSRQFFCFVLPKRNNENLFLWCDLVDTLSLPSATFRASRRVTISRKRGRVSGSVFQQRFKRSAKRGSHFCGTRGRAPRRTTATAA